MKKCRISEIDVCLPDYFQGYPHSENSEVIAVPVDCNTTCEQLRDMLHDEYISGDNENLSDCDIEAALDDLLNGCDLCMKPYPDLEPSDSDSICMDSVYAYFVLELDEEESV